MRTSLRLATAVATIATVLFGIRAGWAQQPPYPGRAPAAAPAAPSPTTAVIDIGHIFRNHMRFKQHMEDMKADLQATEMDFRERSKQIAASVQELDKQYNPGTPNYNAQEEKVTRMRIELQADMEQKKKEFMLREANIYYTVYNEVVEHVRYFSKRYGLRLVLRYNLDPIDAQNANSVMQGVNRNVVFQDDLNITYDILKALNPQTQPATGGHRVSEVPVRRPN